MFASNMRLPSTRKLKKFQPSGHNSPLAAHGSRRASSLVWFLMDRMLSGSGRLSRADRAESASAGARRERLDDRVAHFRGRCRFAALLGKVGGADACIQHVVDGAFQQVGIRAEIEGVAERHCKAEDAGAGVGEALAGDVRGAAMDRLVKRLRAAICLFRTKRSRG